MDHAVAIARPCPQCGAPRFYLERGRLVPLRCRPCGADATKAYRVRYPDRYAAMKVRLNAKNKARREALRA